MIASARLAYFYSGCYHLIIGGIVDSIFMHVKEIRRRNLRKLISTLIAEKTFDKQEEFAAAVEIDKTYLSQMLMEPDQKGARGVSEAKARQIELKLQLEDHYLDRLDESSPFGDSKMHNGILRPLTSESDSDSQFVIVPMYDVKAACGTGYANEEELIKGGLVFKESFLRKKNLSLVMNETGVICGDGHSMEPTINHDDAVLADLRVKTIDEVISGKVYAFVANKELRIKRFFKNINGSIRISSDNPDKTTYPDEIIEKNDLDAIQITGFIKWRCGEI